MAHQSYNEYIMNPGFDQPVDLQDRTLLFSRAVIKFIKPYRNDKFINPIINQLLKSSTSIGANFIEAKNSGSKKDFRNKVFISKKEAAETLYWLQLFEEFTGKDKLKKLQEECTQSY